MAYDDKGYPWQCVRDGANTKEVAEYPRLGNVTNRTHKEWHDSETGRPCDEPEGGGMPYNTSRK